MRDVRRLSPREPLTPWLVAAAVLLLWAGASSAEEPAWPLPCADGTVCWLAWSPATDPDGDPVSYEVVDWDTGYQCAYLTWTTGPRGGRRSAAPHVWPIRFPDIDGACFPREGVANHFVLYAVDPGGARSPGPSNVVTFVGQPVACLEAGCERRCWPGAPRRIPRLPECAP